MKGRADIIEYRHISNGYEQAILSNLASSCIDGCKANLFCGKLQSNFSEQFK
jgi:hypothetical protein